MFVLSCTITVGDVSVEPGSKGVGCLALPDFFADGQSVEIPFVVLNGASPGPCLYVQVAQHGSEVQGLDAIRRLLEDLDAGEMAGVLIYCLPNPLAFRESARATMFDPRPGGMNRIWPGSVDGSPTERMARLPKSCWLTTRTSSTTAGSPRPSLCPFRMRISSRPGGSMPQRPVKWAHSPA